MTTERAIQLKAGDLVQLGGKAIGVQERDGELALVLLAEAPHQRPKGIMQITDPGKVVCHTEYGAWTLSMTDVDLAAARAYDDGAIMDPITVVMEPQR